MSGPQQKITLSKMINIYWRPCLQPPLAWTNGKSSGATYDSSRFDECGWFPVSFGSSFFGDTFPYKLGNGTLNADGGHKTKEFFE